MTGVPSALRDRPRHEVISRPRPTPRATSASARPLPRIGGGPVLATIAVGALAVLALWWHHAPTITGPGDWITNAGRVSGLLVGYAVAVLLALMARIPVVERGVGTDRLTRWHATGGRYVIVLAVTHTLLIIWGYAVSAHVGVVRQTTELLLTYPDVLMATAALALLVIVGICSVRAARCKLRYETWHFVHLYTYLAVALAFAHQFATGADFIDDRMARWAWSALYLSVAALLLRFRVLAPLLMVRRHRLRVAEVLPERAGVVSIYITGRRLEELVAEPGQFFRWRFLTRDLWWAANPYSLSAPPTADLLRITVKDAGDHSAALRTLPPGTPVIAEGPYGAFTAARRRRERKVLFIAGGVGITPLRALFEWIDADAGQLTLLYRARDEEDLILREELERIARRRGARLHYLLGRTRSGHDPLAAEHLRELVPDLRAHEVFLCGPAGMTRHTRRSLRRAGVARRRIHEESFVF